MFSLRDYFSSAQRLMGTGAHGDHAQCLSSPERRALILMVEGNIGAGKSTLCGEMERIGGTEPRPHVVYESVGAHFMEAFYATPQRYAFALQMVQQAKRAAALLRANDMAATTATVFDRSVVGDYAFALWNAASGNMSAADWRLYREQAGDSVGEALTRAGAHPEANVLVYLSDDAAACHVRQVRRDAAVPITIDIGYLRGVHAAHLVCLACVPRAYRIVELDWSAYAHPDQCAQTLAALLAPTQQLPSLDRDALAARARAACADVDSTDSLFLLAQLDGGAAT